MPFFDNQSRDELRRVYVEAWRKRREGLPVEPLEAQVADVIELHPEYHAALERGDEALDARLHARRRPIEPVPAHGTAPGGARPGRDRSARRPAPGVRGPRAAAGSAHEAEHRIIECLAEAMWEAQRAGRPPDEKRVPGGGAAVDLIYFRPHREPGTP